MHNSDTNLGGRNLDWLICQKIGAELEEEIDQNPLNLPKCRLKMLAEVEKTRKALSGDSEAQLSIDNLLDEVDVDRTVTLEEFEELIAPVTQQLHEFIDNTIQMLSQKHNLSVNDLTYVELLGDCTRTPAFLSIIKDKFQKNLRRTMHSTEFAANGATVLAAMQFNAISYDVFPVNFSESDEF